MSERPFPLRPHEVRAVIEGRQTQFRRTRGLNKINEAPDEWVRAGPLKDAHWQFTPVRSTTSGQITRCPFGVPGDRLWGKEAFGIGGARLVDPCINYRADGAQIPVHKETSKLIGNTGFVAIHWRGPGGFTDSPTLVAIPEGWLTSTQMPRWASRIELEIVSVRPERWNTCSNELDAMIHGPGSWERNEWVWVLEVRSVK